MISRKYFLPKYFIRTKTFSRLIDLVESGSSPIVLSGVGGSGKTTLLQALAAHYIQENRTSLMVNANLISGETDIVSSVLDQLREQGISVRQTINITSSSDIASRSLVDLLNALRNPPIVIFDDILEDERSTAIRIAVGEIIRETRCTLVLSGRRNPSWIFDEAPRHYEARVAPLSKSEIAEFVKRRFVDGVIVDNFLALSAISSGNPLILELLSGILKEGDGDLSKIGQEFEPQTIFQHLFERELVQLTNRGTSSANVKAFKSILTTLSVVQRMSIDELPVWDKEIQEAADSSMFVNHSDRYIELAHRSLAVFIYRGLALVPDKAVPITELSFGMEEAERDKLLDELFQEPVEIDRLLTGETTIVVGDRGAGKSALYVSDSPNTC